MDSQPVKNAAQQQNLLIRHIHGIRRREIFKQCPIIVVVENNLGMEASHMATMVRDAPNVEIFFERPETQKAGVCKTQKVTRDYQLVVEDRLGKNNIVFDDRLFSVSTKYEDNVPAIELLLRAQLEAYHWEIREPTRTGEKQKVFLTGKNGSQQDDLYIAFAMALYWGEVSTHRRQIERRMNLN